MKTYKYALALTSQLPFCSVPLRLDAYNQCQYSCAFCFSKARGGNSNPAGLQGASSSALCKRFLRIGRGDIRSALDEFLQRRVPLQFGGMNDPFSPWEKQHGIGLKLLKILAEYNYPTLISTKGIHLLEPEYLSVLEEGNFYVRQSFTALNDQKLLQIEKGVPSSKHRLKQAEQLAMKKIPVSMRLQPVFWNEEKEAERLINSASSAGVRHVSVEYLKWPIETSSVEYKRLRESFPELLEIYTSSAAQKVGREFSLLAELKFPRLLKLKDVAEKLNLLFGFADNEFLHLNNFSSCCNAADKFLKNVNLFDASLLGIIKKSKNLDLIFPAQSEFWLPSYSVFSHINSNSRPDKSEVSERDRLWGAVRAKWNAKAAMGGPESFWGVSSSGKKDVNGNAIYRLSEAIE